MTTKGISQVTSGIKIQVRYEAAYEPVISEVSYYVFNDSNCECTCEPDQRFGVLKILNILKTMHSLGRIVVEGLHFI
jgi:hypothetical protein